ncbi:dihydropyrimidine dehydrogenase subunit A [Novipirellula aureliae]|uniref:Dihydropyrimidine dehydrogenase subunit A n=1 Tax=Novipirellula aureliae TaxID=2527966 RepID=A0A5C6E5F4_9BACT|nr:hypothetical protein [Novipirellula aureliae]TWU44172.1 dihydropyrimidine dehydrogenase subunit A [Novipirellula aureliae]
MLDTNAFADATLDPPGKIAVIGAGPIGIEAALYGRFLGYDVTLYEAAEIGHSMRGRLEEPFPMMPHDALSPLAIAAIEAQSGEKLPLALPMTYGQWIDQALMKLVDGDLLRGRLKTHSRVTRIELLPLDVEGSPDEDSDPEEDTERGDIPPDFRLWIRSQDDPAKVDAGLSIETESVIVATGANCDIECEFHPPLEYFFRLGEASAATGDESPSDYLARCRREITRVFANLGGRADLDLYRPRRV